MDSTYASQYQRLESEHWWWIARRRLLYHWLARVADRAGGPTKAALLEIGCGSGQNVRHIQANYDCYCIEPDDQLREQATATLDCSVSMGLLPDGVDIYARRFSVILLMDVLEHVEADQASLAAIYDLLEPGGSLIMNVPALDFMWSKHDEINQHVRRYSRGGLRERVLSAGFTVHHLQYWGSSLLLPAYLARRLGLDSADDDAPVKIPHPAVNRIAQHVAYLEARTLALAPWLPGLSLFCIAQKPAHDD